MEKLCIIGTGSQARYIIEILEGSKEYTINGLVDLEKRENIGNNINNYIIKCFFKDIEKTFNPHKYKVIVAYGNNIKKKEIVRKLRSMNYKFTSVISNKSYISRSVWHNCNIRINNTTRSN
jgi:FlaA1/EpsC-like NDP-sugar epimerase